MCFFKDRKAEDQIHSGYGQTILRRGFFGAHELSGNWNTQSAIRMRKKMRREFLFRRWRTLRVGEFLGHGAGQDEGQTDQGGGVDGFPDQEVDDEQG